MIDGRLVRSLVFVVKGNHFSIPLPDHKKRMRKMVADDDHDHTTHHISYRQTITLNAGLFCPVFPGPVRLALVVKGKPSFPPNQPGKKPGEKFLILFKPLRSGRRYVGRPPTDHRVGEGDFIQENQARVPRSGGVIVR